MKRIDTVEELKKIQLDILLSVNNFCSKNNIKYSIACGTLIGAIRHKGFIPWDDDIDICLLRSDYELLVKTFPCLLENKYSLETLERNKKWNRPYGKIVDNRTILYEDSSNNIEGVGIGIDVFPLDDVPDTNLAFKLFLFFQRLLVKTYTLKSLAPVEETLWKNVIIRIGYILLYPFSHRFFAKILERFSKFFNKRGYKNVYMSNAALHAKFACNKDLFSSYINVEFEGYPVKAMVGYDEYLRNTYGDYMCLPPENERTPQHSFKGFWKDLEE